MYTEQHGQAIASNGLASGPDAPSTTGRRGAGGQPAFAQRFASIVAVLMRDTNFRQMPLADLEWLVIPAVMSGQCRLAHSPPPGRASGKQPDVMLPVAVALWASVSDEIDARLSASLDRRAILKPNEWTTGSNVWLLAVAGDKRAIPTFLKQLEAQDFEGKTAKVRARGANGSIEVLTLAAYRELKARDGAETKPAN